MLSTAVVALSLLQATTVLAAQAITYANASSSPEEQSPYYVGRNNGTLQNSPVVPGAAFDRFIVIYLENTDFAVASTSQTLQALAKEGILFDGYHGVTHPSEPNYVAAVSGEFYGLGGDDFLALPKNVSTIVDLLEAKDISWASYQENMPFDGCGDNTYTSADYNNVSAAATPYTYYYRKHNPLIIHDSIASIPERALRVRNFNDFAVDLDADVLPQWSFITPNILNDCHNTNIDYCSKFLDFWLANLMKNKHFNGDKTLILLTFDENENYAVNNQVYTLALGGAIPKALRGTTDSTYYTHYSQLSTVQANWKLGNLGRQDTNKTLANVFNFVAEATGYENNKLSNSTLDLPLTNLTKTYPGPLNPSLYVNVLSPNVTAVGAGGGPVFIYPGTNTSFTAATAPAPVNLKAQGATSPYFVTEAPYSYGQYVNGSAPSNSSTTTASSAPAASPTPLLSVAGLVGAAAGLL